MHPRIPRRALLTPPDIPSSLFVCFLRPCDVPPTCRVVVNHPDLDHVFGCYKHATQIKALLIEHGYTNAVLAPVNEPLPAPATATTNGPPNLNAIVSKLRFDPTVSPCFVDETHSRGIYEVTASPDMGPFRVCDGCLELFISALRDSGHLDIHITVPELRPYIPTPWRK